MLYDRIYNCVGYVVCGFFKRSFMCGGAFVCIVDDAEKCKDVPNVYACKQCNMDSVRLLHGSVYGNFDARIFDCFYFVCNDKA